MALNSIYKTASTFCLLLALATACAPVAPSIDKNKFLSSKAGPEGSAGVPAPLGNVEGVEKVQVITRTEQESSQFELNVSWVSSKKLAATLQKLEKTDALVFPLQIADGTIARLFNEGIELNTPKTSVRKVQMFFVEKETDKNNSEKTNVEPKTVEICDLTKVPVTSHESSKADDKVVPTCIEKIVAISTAPNEVPELNVSAFTPADGKETQWNLDAAAPFTETETAIPLEKRIDSAVFVIFPNKLKIKK